MYEQDKKRDDCDNFLSFLFFKNVHLKYISIVFASKRGLSIVPAVVSHMLVFGEFSLYKRKMSSNLTKIVVNSS